MRAALKDRLSSIAGSNPAVKLNQLQRQFAYDRLLTRLFSAAGADTWVLKGAGALLARLHAARHSVDLDLYWRSDELAAAEQALRSAAKLDLGDYFTFGLGPARSVEQAGAVRRVPVVAYLGGREYARFRVDLVGGIIMTGQPDEAPPLVEVDMAGLVRCTYLVYPLADHVADKMAAIHVTHGRAGASPMVSTRVKDLVDLVLIATTHSIDAAALRVAVRSEEARRGLTLPATVTIPDIPIWDSSDRKFVAETPGLAGHATLEAAITLVRSLTDPILGARTAGTWVPDRLMWEDEASVE